jgi:hypothetical protein
MPVNVDPMPVNGQDWVLRPTLPNFRMVGPAEMTLIHTPDPVATSNDQSSFCLSRRSNPL